MPPPTPPTATLTITINQFRPLGNVFPIDSSMSMPPTQGFTLSDENITITVPGPVQLTFVLPDTQYVLLGMAFSAYNPTTKKTDIGQGAFPLVTITRSSTAGTTMTVQDAGTSAVRYNYLILVQNAVNGSIGIIDPGIRNEPN